MIFRLSQRLAKKIKVAPAVVLPANTNPFVDWSAHLFTADRTQYVILTNTASLYSTIMLGRGAANEKQFEDKAVSCIQEFMAFDGLSFLFEQLISPALGDVVFSKALNRSVTGSMNDLVYHGKMWMLEEGLSPFDACLNLNDMPMSALSYRNPRETFKRLPP